VAWTARQIEAHAGAVSITALQQHTGWSKTRLTSTFEQQIGVTPKRYARIHRFRRALQLVHEGTLPLAQIALTAGYYDQPHFNAEFRALSGFSPTEFLAARRYPGSGSLAEDAG
jgi:AraC-like DNA-binding protein